MATSNVLPGIGLGAALSAALAGGVTADTGTVVSFGEIAEGTPYVALVRVEEVRALPAPSVVLAVERLYRGDLPAVFAVAARDGEQLPAGTRFILYAYRGDDFASGGWGRLADVLSDGSIDAPADVIDAPVTLEAFDAAYGPGATPLPAPTAGAAQAAPPPTALALDPALLAAVTIVAGGAALLGAVALVGRRRPVQRASPDRTG